MSNEENNENINNQENIENENENLPILEDLLIYSKEDEEKNNLENNHDNNIENKENNNENDFEEDFEILSYKSEIEFLKEQLKEKDKLINEYNIQKSNILGDLTNPDEKINELYTLLQKEKVK